MSKNKDTAIPEYTYSGEEFPTLRSEIWWQCWWSRGFALTIWLQRRGRTRNFFAGAWSVVWIAEALISIISRGVWHCRPTAAPWYSDARIGCHRRHLKPNSNNDKCAPIAKRPWVRCKIERGWHTFELPWKDGQEGTLPSTHLPLQHGWIHREKGTVERESRKHLGGKSIMWRKDVA